MNFEQAA
jgi:hypothetical protein